MHRQFVHLLFSVLLMVSLPAWSALPVVDSQGQPLPSLAPMLKKTNPAVVNISTRYRQKAQNPLLNDPFFKHFFNAPNRRFRQQQREASSAGSGVIVDADKGIVVTNHHVIDKAEEISVALNDGRSFQAELIGSDPEVDIAVLKIEAERLTALPIANSDFLEIGDFVVAIGNPFGIGQTATSGMVSALSRSGLGIEGYEDFIQTDASINPGNSGGALVNLRGELVGINTAILAPSGGNVGIGFAIPTNMVRASVDQILEHGEVQRGQLGVFIQDITPELADAFGLDRHQQGVLISKVIEGSGAEKAGVQEGDLVIAIDGKKVSKGSELRNAVGVRRIGEKVKLTVLRDGKKKNLRVKINDNRPAKEAKVLFSKLEGAELTNSEDNSGVIIRNIEQGSPVAFTGLRPGDIIVEANRVRVKDIDDLRSAIEKGGDKLLLRINRKGAALFLVLR